MSTYDLILKRRTIRRFAQREVKPEILLKMVNAARLAPSGANMQPLKYKIISGSGPEKDEVFRQLRWANYITPLRTPQKGEEPAAYIIILVDTGIRKSGCELDIGAAAQNIILTALEEGIGSCWIGSFNNNEIRQILSIPENYIINSVIALGYPAESPVGEDMDETEDEGEHKRERKPGSEPGPEHKRVNGSIKYYLDENDVLHVPKRRLEDVIL